MWRDGTETMGAMGYDPSTLTQNGVAPQHIMPTLQYGRHYGQVGTHFIYFTFYNVSVRMPPGTNQQMLYRKLAFRCCHCSSLLILLAHIGYKHRT